MRLVTALILLLSLPALSARDKLTDEEIKRLADEALNQCDSDSNGSITLAEVQARLEAFYIDFAKAGKAEAKQDAVRALYPGLLTLQHFLSADLDDDNIVKEADLKLLFAHPHDEFHTLTDAVWTLSDADIDLLIEDFILRIRKGATSHPHDRLRKITGKGKTKAEKIADRAAPYEQFVARMVMLQRVEAVAESNYTQDQLSSLYTKLGRRWVWDFSLPGKEGATFSFVGEVMREEDAGVSRSGIREEMEGYALDYKVPHPTLNKDYHVKVAITKTTITVKAGTFECDYFEITCKSASTKVWVLNKHPSLVVKQEHTQLDESWATELVEFDE